MRDEIHSKGELIKELIAVYCRKGRIPKACDVKEEHEKGLCASYSTYYKRFSGFQNAIALLKDRLNLEQLTLGF